MLNLQIQNQEELQSLLGLFDAAVRHLGLNGARAAAVFQSRLQQQVEALNKKAQAKAVATAPAGGHAEAAKPPRRSGKNKGGR